MQKEKQNFVVACLRPPKNAKLGMFTSQSCKNGQRNVQKSVVHVQSCCFANKTYCVLTFSLPSASLDLKVPNEQRRRLCYYLCTA